MAKRSWHFTPIVFALFLFTISAPARTTEPDCPAGESANTACEESRIELARITVTATRRESPVDRVPVSVTVLSGDKLRAMGAASFEDYARSVPGLTFSDPGFGGKKYVIRGVTTSVFTESRAATAVYLDETPITNASFSGLSYSPDPLLVDIARIEVLRGPQGTLFGSGSMGGAIRIMTNKPDLHAFGGFAEAILSSTEHGGFGHDLRAMLNAPLKDELAAIRAVAYYRDEDGWIDNTLLGQKNVNNNETSGLRLAGTWSNQDRLTIDGNLVYQDRQSDGSMIDQGNPPWTQQRVVEEPNEDEWKLANLNIDYEFDWGRLISTSSWIDRVFDNRLDNSEFFNTEVYPTHPFIGPDVHTTVTVISRDEQQEFVQEFRFLSSSDNRLNWLLGLFYQDQDFRFSQDFPAPGFDEQTGGLVEFFGAADNLLVGRAKRSLQQTARREARAALALDPGSIDALLALEIIDYREHATTLAETVARIRSLLARAPNHPKVNFRMGLMMNQVGRFHEAARYMGKEVELDPLAVLPPAFYHDALISSGRTEEARAFMKQRNTYQFYRLSYAWLTMRLLEKDFQGAREFFTDLEPNVLFWHDGLAVMESIDVKSPNTTRMSLLLARLVTVAEQGDALLDSTIAADMVQAADEGLILHFYLFQWLAAAGLNDAAFDLARERIALGDTFFRESGVLLKPAFRAARRDPRVMELFDATRQLDYWLETGEWPDYCADPELPYDCEEAAQHYMLWEPRDHDFGGGHQAGTDRQIDN